MRLLTSTAALLATGAAVLSAPLAGAPAAKPRLISSPAAQVGTRWTGMVAAANRPVVVARLRGSRQPVAVRRIRSGRYRLQAVFRAPGRWALTAGRQRLGSVLVRAAPLRLTNALDVVVEPTGSLLVADFSNRVFRLSDTRLTLVAGNGRPAGRETADRRLPQPSAFRSRSPSIRAAALGSSTANVGSGMSIRPGRSGPSPSFSSPRPWRTTGPEISSSPSCWVESSAATPRREL